MVNMKRKIAMVMVVVLVLCSLSAVAYAAPEVTSHTFYGQNGSRTVYPSNTSYWVGYAYKTSGSYVTIVQAILLHYSISASRPSCDPVDVDGYFGPNTYSALYYYQYYRGLKTDGICGEGTWNDMISYWKSAGNGDMGYWFYD